MIGDLLRARVKDAQFRDILDRTEWVQVPYPIYPYLPDEGVLDWHADRVPEHLIPRVPGTVGILAKDRMPFQTTGLYTPGESGALLVTERYGRTDEEVRLVADQVIRAAIPHVDTRNWATAHVDGACVANMIGYVPRDEFPLIMQTHLFLIVRMDPAQPRSDPYATRVLWPILSAIGDGVEEVPDAVISDGLRLVHTINTTGTLKLNGLPATFPLLTEKGLWDKLVETRGGGSVRVLRDQWWLDTGHTSLSIATASALLNARNLRKEVVTPPHIRAARRRGDPPPYRYHVLKIDAARARAHANGTGEGDALALHLRRGHWKVFTPSAPLLGKHIGRWWWHPHLAGQADRVVEKDYRVDGNGPR